MRTRRRVAWASQLHHLLGWVISVQTAKQHYSRTSLFTDDAGAEILVDGVGLQFDQVTTDLNALHDHDPDWWAVGKIFTHTLQHEPYVHIDNDVFLWKRLPDRMEKSPVLAQNPELYDYGYSRYQVANFEFAVNSVGGWLPEELKTYLPLGGILRAECCGVVGGNALSFMKHYAQLATKLIEEPRNQPAWPLLNDKQSGNLIFEQYLLAACAHYHQGKPESPFRNVRIEHLFEDENDAANTACVCGYTHMISDAKRNPFVIKRLEARARKDFPDLYQRCVDFTRKSRTW